MSKRETYSDYFTGAADKGIRAILETSDDEEIPSQRLRRVLLKVINNELTPRQKEIIMLYYFKGMDTLHIAERLGITPQAVSAAMSRGRLRIYRILQYYI